jgi:hypothetical protein
MDAYKGQKAKNCKFLPNTRFPGGFATNLAKVNRLKTHDCYILLQGVLPAGLKGIAPPDKYEEIPELGRFFKDLCTKPLRIDVLERMKVEIVEIH